MKMPCSGTCGQDLLVKDSFDQGTDYRAKTSYRTCRRCSLVAGAKANLELARKRLEREILESA
jgi:hypothetical protein